MTGLTQSGRGWGRGTPVTAKQTVTGRLEGEVEGIEFALMTPEEVATAAEVISPTGDITASVQPRSGLLADLLALAGLVGEVSHPTDCDNKCRVLHNGVAGGAVALWANGGRTITMDFSGPQGPKYLPVDLDGQTVHFTKLVCVGTPDEDFPLLSIDQNISDSMKGALFTIINRTGLALDFEVFDNAPTALPANATRLATIVENGLYFVPLA